jgi:hypothetical protein
MGRKHNHYFKNVKYLEDIDVYRVLSLFGVTDQAIGHAIKKLLVAGGRGHKNIHKDIQEAIDTLERWKEMQLEDSPELSEHIGQELCIVGNTKRQGKFGAMFDELFTSMGLKPAIECDGKTK